MNKVTLVIVCYLLMFDKYIFISNICYTHHCKIVTKIHLIEKSDLNRQYFVWWYLWLLRWETHFQLKLHYVNESFGMLSHTEHMAVVGEDGETLMVEVEEDRTKL